MQAVRLPTSPMRDSPVAEGAEDSSSKKRPAPRGTASYARKRGNAACQVCRARRTKCDRALPRCSFCEKTGAACVRSPIDLSSLDPASLRILERIEDLSQQFRIWTEEQASVPNSRNPISSAWQVPSIGTTHARPWLFPRSAEEVLPHAITRPHLLSILKAGSEATHGVLSTNSPISTFADLEPHSVRFLTDNFFDYVHVKNPILDEHSTRLLVSRLVLHGVDWSPQSCLALLVCALGALATPLGPSYQTTPGAAAHTNAHSYFLAAQKRLGSCIVEGGLIQSQCLFLTGVYLMTIFRPVEAWRIFNQSLACCQDFSFLTDVDSKECGVSNTSWSTDMVSEQAVYWSAWKSEQELRSDLQPPDFCSQAEFPKFFPTPPAPAETDTDQQVKGWTFYLTEISLRRQSLMLAADISDSVSSLSRLGVDKLVQMLPERLAQVDDWLRNISQPMSLETPPEHDDICKFVLRGHVLNFYEMLHWPFLDLFIGLTYKDEQQQDRSRAYLDLAQQAKVKSLAEKALSLHVERIQVNKPGFFHRHHGTWFMIRSCSRSATMLLRAAMYKSETSLPEESLVLPEDWHNAVLEVIELHRHWRPEVPDIAYRLSVLEEMMTQTEDG